MTSKTLKSAIWLTLLASAVAFAAPSGGKGPPTDKGNKPASEVSNSLSVPAIMAGEGSKFAINCPTDGFSPLTAPTKPPVEYPEDCAAGEDGGLVCVGPGFFYVQRDGAWQAPCSTADPGIDVAGKWGDNLAGGSASLKTGSPIRVEFLLLDASGTAVNQTGYFVIKLQPSELDRESDYGHLAAPDASAPTGFKPIVYTVGDLTPDGGTFPAIVFDPSATLKIERLDNGVPVIPAVYNGTASGEINATGKIVYGYNLRVQVAGTYRITYTFPRVTFTSACNAGVCAGSEAVLEITVAGGGGSRPPRK